MVTSPTRQGPRRPAPDGTSAPTRGRARRQDHVSTRAEIPCQPLSRHEAVPLDAALARRAAELGHAHKLAACDSLVYPAAEGRGVVLLTADPDLQGLPGVEFHEKPGASGETRKAKREAGRSSSGPK